MVTAESDVTGNSSDVNLPWHYSPCASHCFYILWHLITEQCMNCCLQDAVRYHIRTFGAQNSWLNI